MTKLPAVLSLGVVGSSGKPDERRLPIHPDHVERIDSELRSRIVLEHGYGDGVVQNPQIVSFQGRAAEYPHARGERSA